MELENKISIVVPIYNTAEFLERCLDSILVQTYKNFEVLMINDGSTDSSREICEKYCKFDSRFRLINQENSGLSESRNRGIREATGDFIVFIDSDDYIIGNHLESNLKFINKFGVDMVISSYYIVKDSEKMNPNFREPNIGTISSEKAIEELLDGSFGNYSWKIFASKNIYTEHNITYPRGRQFEDIATTYKLLANSRKIYMSSKKIYYYFQRENSITHVHNETDLSDIIATFSEMRSFIKKIYPVLEPKVLKYEFNMIFMLIIRLKNWENQVTPSFSKTEKAYMDRAMYRLRQILKSRYGKSRLFYRQRVKYFLLRTRIFPLVLKLNQFLQMENKNI